MATEFIHVIAEVRLLATSEGGKIVPICGSYRPNHNFFEAEDAVMTAGFIDLPDGVMVHPGETVTVPIAIWWWPDLDDQVYIGREWRIQEGRHLVGFGKVIQLTGDRARRPLGRNSRPALSSERPNVGRWG